MANLTDIPTGLASRHDLRPWTFVRAASDVPLDRGFAALVDGNAVAVFRLSPCQDHDEQWRAVSHFDPQTGAPVMARGLVGSHEIDGVVYSTVASPLNKLRYDLVTGKCLDDESPGLRVFEIYVTDNHVLVR